MKVAESTVYALVYKSGIASSIAHDHVIKATGATGTLSFTPSLSDSFAISVSLPIAGLSPDEDIMRKLVGLPDRLTDAQREEIKGLMLSVDQLAATTYSTISFTSTSSTSTSATPDGESYMVTGNFTLHGVTKSLTVPLTVTSTPSGSQVGGRFSIKQSDYGYTPYSALMGALAVKDEVDIVVDLHF